MKKSLCLIIAVVMIMSVLTACGGGSEPTSGGMEGPSKIHEKYPEISEDIVKAAEEVLRVADEVIDKKLSFEGAVGRMNPYVTKLAAFDDKSIADLDTQIHSGSIKFFATSLKEDCEMGALHKNQGKDMPEDMQDLLKDRNNLADDLELKGK